MQSLLTLLIENWSGFATSVVGSAIGALGSYYGYKSYVATKVQASRQASLTLTAFGIEPTVATLCALPFAEETVFIIPLALHIENSGELSAKNVELFIDLPDQCFTRDVPRTVSAIAAARGSKLAVEEGRTEHITNIYFSVGEIGPGQTAVVVPSLFATQPTERPIDIVATTRDKKKVQIKGRFTYSLAINAKATYTDGQPAVLPIRLGLLKGTAEGAKDLLNDIARGRQEKASKASVLPDSLSLVAFKAFSEESLLLDSGATWRVLHGDHQSAIVITARVAVHGATEA